MLCFSDNLIGSDIIDGHGKNPESDVSTLTKALERSHSDIASEISHFNKLSNMIRRTSKEHQTSKMKNIQVKDEDEDVERMLLYIFTGYISNKFPRASDIIQQRLAEAMILRRKRVLCDKSEAEVCGRLGNHVTSLLRSLALKSLPPYEEDMEADVGSERDGCDGSELHSVRTIDDLSIGNSSSTCGMNYELSKLSETEEADFVNDVPYDLSSRHTDMWSSWVNDWISNKPTLQHLQQMYDAKDPIFYFMLEKAKERLALSQIPPQQQQQQPISSQSPEEIPPLIEANTLASNVSQTPVWYSIGGLEAVDLRGLGPLIPGYIINSSDVPGVTEQGLEEMHICSEQLDPLVPHRGQPSA